MNVYCIELLVYAVGVNFFVQRLFSSSFGCKRVLWYKSVN